MRVSELGSLALSLFASAGCAVATPRPPETGQLEAPEVATRASAALAFAQGQIGKRYCWGGIGPSCFDCSGLVSRAWGAVGVRLPHSSEGIAAVLPEVPLEDVRPGDVLWWPGHVALYAGGGYSIEALDRQDGVVRRAAKVPRRAFRPE
jgi:cell wall-associated NlpC family hydrolase